MLAKMAASAGDIVQHLKQEAVQIVVVDGKGDSSISSRHGQALVSANAGVSPTPQTRPRHEGELGSCGARIWGMLSTIPIVDGCLSESSSETRTCDCLSQLMSAC
jgi:hypothetical protein